MGERKKKEKEIWGRDKEKSRKKKSCVGERNRKGRKGGKDRKNKGKMVSEEIIPFTFKNFVWPSPTVICIQKL